jgi:hypothetical protein
MSRFFFFLFLVIPSSTSTLVTNIPAGNVPKSWRSEGGIKRGRAGVDGWDGFAVCVCVCGVAVGFDEVGEGAADEGLDDEEIEEIDNRDPAAGASKTIFFGGQSPKDDRKCFFLFLFLERRESIVSDAIPSSFPSSAGSTLSKDFGLGGAGSKGTPFAILGATGGIEPRSWAFLRRRRRLREWVDGFPRPGGIGIGVDLDVKEASIRM